MEDGELIASWTPQPATNVLVLSFDDFEEMLLFQERIQAAHRLDRDDHGEVLPQVETLWMGQTQFGRRELLGGAVTSGLLISTPTSLEETEQARRAWAATRMQLASPMKPGQGMSHAWRPTAEQMDLLEKYAAEVLEKHPAGSGGGTPRIKTSVARDGFNKYACDQSRPDLQFQGVKGGKAFSETLQAMFEGDVGVRISDGGHPYFHGLRRKEGVNRKYFRLP